MTDRNVVPFGDGGAIDLAWLRQLDVDEPRPAATPSRLDRFEEAASRFLWLWLLPCGAIAALVTLGFIVFELATRVWGR